MALVLWLLAVLVLAIVAGYAASAKVDEILDEVNDRD